MRAVDLLIASGLLGLATVACSNATVIEASSDALRCAAAMGVAAKLAKDDGDMTEERQYTLRALWFGEKASLVPRSAESDKRLDEAVTAFVAPGVDMIGIAAGCNKQASDDPQFKQWSRERYERREFPFA